MKIAVDTNIILRVITCDDAHLLKKARHLIKRYATNDIFVGYGILLEAYYVLAKYYKYSHPMILEAFNDLMRIEQFFFEHETAIRLALAKATAGQPFCDSLIGEVGALKNLKTYTFDKKLKNNSSFVVL